MKARKMIEKEMDKKGYIDDSTYLGANSFLHQVAHEFYNHNDSSEKTDAIYSQILTP